MKILTTTIGSYPKPDYLPTPDWFRIKHGNLSDQNDPTNAYNQLVETRNAHDLETLVKRAINEVLEDQVNAGIDIPTDGEMRRENYIYYHCRHLNGFDFNKFANKSMRNGSWVADVPCITSQVTSRDEFLVQEWKQAQEMCAKPVKVTVPGALTIIDSFANQFYKDEKSLSYDIADSLNIELKRLVDAGCKYIQIDEPLFARLPEQALDYGIECLNRSLKGIENKVHSMVHICCGYPDKVDNENYPKADRLAYHDLAKAIDESSIGAVSLEDAHRPVDLKLLELFRNTTVALGVIAIARSQIETVDQIKQRLHEALSFIEPARLMAAPDCGLAMLDRNTVMKKLSNMCTAVKEINQSLSLAA